jgi:hypothetical protein
MQQAATEAERTIAILSPNYLSALYTHPEWQAAFAQDPTGERGILLPVRVRECEVTGLLAQIIFIDLVGLDEQTSRETLYRGVKRVRAKPPVKPPFPDLTERSVPKHPQFPGTRNSLPDGKEGGSASIKRFHDSAPLASWIFGGLILLFLMLVVFVEINPGKFTIVRFLMALSAAFFALFFVGGVLLQGTLKGLYISATGGFVLFILIQFVFNPFSGNTVTTTFGAPSGIKSADLVIKTESRQSVITMSLKSDNRQTVNLPPGNYIYELTNIRTDTQSSPPPCYQSIENPPYGNFKVNRGRENTIELPELSSLRIIPDCDPEGTGSPSPSTSTNTNFSDWMEPSEYQEEFNRQKEKGLYPHQVEGREINGVTQLRAYFKLIPSEQFLARSWTGMDKKEYEQRDRDLLSQGFLRIHVQTYVDSSGVVWYQATWAKYD